MALRGHCVHAYSKPLGSVTAWSSRISGFTKIGMAMAIPAKPLLLALDIQRYGIHFYRIFLSVYGSEKQNIDIGALIILQSYANNIQKHNIMQVPTQILCFPLTNTKQLL